MATKVVRIRLPQGVDVKLDFVEPPEGGEPTANPDVALPVTVDESGEMGWDGCGCGGGNCVC